MKAFFVQAACWSAIAAIFGVGALIVAGYAEMMGQSVSTVLEVGAGSAAFAMAWLAYNRIYDWCSNRPTTTETAHHASDAISSVASHG